MKESFVYILKCRDGTYYTGVTNNIIRRFAEHQEGINPKSYTHNRRPVKLEFFAPFSSIEEAIEKEKQIKKWSQAKKLALIEGRYNDLPNLAKKKFKED